MCSNLSILTYVNLFNSFYNIQVWKQNWWRNFSNNVDNFETWQNLIQSIFCLVLQIKDLSEWPPLKLGSFLYLVDFIWSKSLSKSYHDHGDLVWKGVRSECECGRYESGSGKRLDWANSQTHNDVYGSSWAPL